MTTLRLALLVLLLVTAPAPALALAEPRAVLSAEGITITLFDEPCGLAQVTNLPMRAIWQQDGKVFEGCFGVFLGGAVVAAFFDDGSVAVIPAQGFQRLKGV